MDPTLVTMLWQQSDRSWAVIVFSRTNGECVKKVAILRIGYTTMNCHAYIKASRIGKKANTYFTVSWCCIAYSANPFFVKIITIYLKMAYKTF